MRLSSDKLVIFKVNQDVPAAPEHGASRVEIRFTPRGEGKSQIAVDHGQRCRGKNKAFWAKIYENLREKVEIPAGRQDKAR